MGLVFALTLPGLVVVLVAVAFLDHALLRTTGRGIVPWRRDRAVSATGFDLLHASVAPGKQHELDERHRVELVRDDEEDGAPPRGEVDLTSGVVRIRRVQG